jgi:integrase
MLACPDSGFYACVASLSEGDRLPSLRLRLLGLLRCALGGLPAFVNPFWSGESNAEDCASTWRKALSRLFVLARVEGTPHQFRHTMVKRLLVSGVPIQLVAQILGHRKVEITQKHYNKWVPERQKGLEDAVRSTWSR